MEAETVKLERANVYYRRAMEGHVYVQKTFDALLNTVGERVKRLGGRPRVLELGSHAGFVSETLLRKWPHLDLVVSDDDVELVALAKRRLGDGRVRFHCDPLETLKGAFDLVISVARHHHLSHGYLPAVRRVMRPESAYVLADELCPEYCGAEDLARLEQAKVLRIAGGYVFTSEADFQSYQTNQTVPKYASELEERRRRALWRWYRVVVDHAVELGYFDIAAGELQSARDDLVTGSEAEHKFSPAIVEREFALAGFRRLSRQLVGPVNDPDRHSMFVYEFAPE